MANTKETMIDAVATALEGLSDINSATRDQPVPLTQKSNAPYVGIISMNETVLVSNSDVIRWKCDLEMILIQSGNDIEKLIDVVRDAMLDGMAATVGALEFRLVSTFKTALVEQDSYSSARMFFEMIYVSTIGAS